MVEVFKTDVSDKDFARVLIEQIHIAFSGYTANFDLDDCDRILRIKCEDTIHATELINFLKALGCIAEILEDEVFLEARSFDTGVVLF